MTDENNLMKFPQQIEESLSGVPWTRGLAAGSLVASAVLLVTGRRRSAAIIAAAGATIALLENPDAVRDFWNSIPKHVRTGQEFLVRAEGFVDEINRQTNRVRDMLSRES